MSTLTEKLAAAQAARAAEEAAKIVTGVQSSADGVSAAPLEAPPEISAEEIKEGFDATGLPENTFFLLQGRQLLMPGGVMKKADAKGLLYAKNAAELERLSYFAASGYCVKVS